jgi:hypothetical protein
MKHSTKLLLFIVGGFATLFVVAAVVVAIWVSHGGSGVMQQALNADVEGKRLGALVDAQACVDTAFAHHVRVEGGTLMGVVAERILLENCLKASRPTAGLCDSVPAVTEFLRAGTWATRVCHARGLDDMYCPQLPQELLAYCGRRRVT